MKIRRLSGVALACSLVASLGGAARAAYLEAPDELPNLAPLPAFDVAVDNADLGQQLALRFSVSIANRGSYALDLLGLPQTDDDSVAYQCVMWHAPRVCAERVEVGRFIWHPHHGHHHFESFATYELRKLRPSGAPNMRPGGLVATAGKVSFCLMDSDADTDQRSLENHFPHPVYVACEAGNQGISPGWRDTYGSRLPGQQLLLGGIPDGDYALVIGVDPEGRLFESNELDNVAASRLTIGYHGHSAHVVCEYVGISPECLPPTGEDK